MITKNRNVSAEICEKYISLYPKVIAFETLYNGNLRLTSCMCVPV